MGIFNINAVEEKHDAICIARPVSVSFRPGLHAYAFSLRGMHIVFTTVMPVSTDVASEKVGGVETECLTSTEISTF